MQSLCREQAPPSHGAYRDGLALLRPELLRLEPPDLAALVGPEGRALAERGESLVGRAVSHQGSPNSAACFALMARHYKRTASHTMNVLTGLTMSIHALDYFDESR